MADEEEQAGNGDEEPIQVPLHDPLPPPPDFSYTRPALTRPPASTSLNGSAPNRMSGQSPSGPSANSSFSKLGAGLAAGVTFVASVIAGFLIGQWIDHRWNHGGGLPWGTLVFSLLGVAAGFLNLFRVVSATDRSDKR